LKLSTNRRAPPLTPLTRHASKLCAHNQQLGPSQHDAAQAVADAQLSEFERCRKNCARLALDTRKAIKDRDELLNRGIKNTDSIKASSTSRQKLAALRAEVAKMDVLYQAEKKKAEKMAGKKGQGLLQADQLSEKLKTLELVQQHVEGKQVMCNAAFKASCTVSQCHGKYIQMRILQHTIVRIHLLLLTPPPLPPRMRLA